jgi:hypothetical protein
MNHNIFMLKLQLAEIARQNEQKRLQYIESIKQGAKP